MVRQLYRIYLYVVSVALLIFAAVALFQLLDTLLAFTPLRGGYRPIPTGRERTQQLVFVVVAWLISGLLGGLHYWLIRRDMASDSTAGGGAVRAFFLNLAQAVAVLIAVFAASGAFTALAFRGSGPAPETASAFAATMTAGLVAGLLEWERRRAPAATGLAITFQRLNLYGVPLIVLLTSLANTWDAAMKTSLDAVLLRANVYHPPDPLPTVGFHWLATLVGFAAIGLYALMARDDERSILRTVAHLASFGIGVVFLLVGLDRIVELGLRALLAIPVSWSDVAHPWSAPYNFVSPTTFGLLLVLVYGFWLRREAALLPLGPTATPRAMEALAAMLMAVSFYWGMGRALYTAFEAWAGAPGHTFRAEWAAALALIVTGLSYIPLAMDLRTASREQPEASAPHRALVLALLAGGVVTGAVGLAIVLYTLGTALLRVPLANWQDTARAGSAALIVGAMLVAIYGVITLREHYVEPLMAGLSAVAKPATPPPASVQAGRGVAPTPELIEGIERILDDYAAHALDREHATQRIIELMHTPGMLGMPRS